MSLVLNCRFRHWSCALRDAARKLDLWACARRSLVGWVKPTDSRKSWWVSPWRDEKSVLNKLRVHPDFRCSVFPPLRRGGRGGGHGTIFAVKELVHGLLP